VVIARHRLRERRRARADAECLAGIATSRRVMVVETSPSGHRLVFVREIVAEALRRRSSVVFATTESVLRDPAFARHVAAFAQMIELQLVPGKLTVKGLQVRASALGCDLVIVPDALKYRSALLPGLTRRLPLVRLVIMNDPLWEVRRRWLPSPKLLLKRGVLLLSGARRGVQILWLRGQGSRRTASIVVDPLLLDGSVSSIREDAARMRSALMMDEGTFWFGIVGALDARKNVPLVIDALRKAARETGIPVGLALLGPWSDPVTERSASTALATCDYRVVRRHDALTNREMNVAVAALDCVVMAYSTSAPNSTAAKAAALGVRVAAAGSASFRRFVSQVTGLAGASLDVDAVARELVAALQRPLPEPRKLTGSEGLTDPLLAPISVPRRYR